MPSTERTPVAVDPTDGQPQFGWWEIRSERERLFVKVRGARWWIANADASTPEKYAYGLMNARSLLDEAMEMLEVEHGAVGS